ncbi:unnamed protein product [Adineta ricciae]|uniref:Uncharacterized protein n=1 Tax=Adineta ricciae TaxID=249248 RepID=A0A813W1Z4_ADIRI|nr:unnamed protein product [Adineta ricciae]
MLNSSVTASQILPNNKVYRQLFDAQSQLTDVYNRVRTNQLSQSVNIIPPPDSIPLVRNIRPHDVQKRQWMASLPYANDPNINPITLLFRDERKRRQNEQQQELDELKREVFNLPDNIDYDHIDESHKGDLTERIKAKRQHQFDQLWIEFLNKITDINHNLLVELERITRECNKYYEQGDQEIDGYLHKLFTEKDITSLTIQSFEQAFYQLNQLLPPRLLHIQEYCQSIEELELERIHRIRDLFKHYSGQLYQTHHLPDKEIAIRLEKQANELNTQILDNRRVYAELEARLLAGETVRAHRYQRKLVNYQSKWGDATWLIHRDDWLSKLSSCKTKLESIIFSTCESIGGDIAKQTHAFIAHVNSLNSFLPPISTHENAQRWYSQGYDLVDIIVHKRQILVSKINDVITKEIAFLNEELERIREEVLQTCVYDNEQLEIVTERDIVPLLEERKYFLKNSILDRVQSSYEQSTHSMYDVLECLFAFIEPLAKQWDTHQIRLEDVTGKLLDMMHECRRPHDLENEKKLTKLDLTLDEMRSASSEPTLATLLQAAYKQLDRIKAGYAAFYDKEHEVVNQYSSLIADEVNQYRNEMLEYLQARPIDPNTNDEQPLLSFSHQCYTTSLARRTYELHSQFNKKSDSTEEDNAGDDRESHISVSVRSSSDEDPRVRNGQDEAEMPAFLTEVAPADETVSIPFHQAFRIPSNLRDSIIFILSRAFLDYYDQWEQETVRRAEAVMYAKHHELDKELDLQLHLHEPRRTRIQTDVYNVRIAELMTHDDRVERHMCGVEDKLREINNDYDRMLNEFSKSIDSYKNDMFSLEHIFVNATTTGRLVLLQDRLKKQRDTFMNYIRISLRKFRTRFEEIMQQLREANANFRQSLQTFSEGGNFSLDEISTFRKKLEKTAFQIDKTESNILKEMEKSEKKQLEQANKILNQFRDKFKYHMIDLQFIELTNRWISEAQVKIKAEVGYNNQQAHVFKALVLLYEAKIDSILNPNLDKEPATINDVRDLYHQIVSNSYERALYLKCLQSELVIPAALVSNLRAKGLITEEELVNDLHNTTRTEESGGSQRSSRQSAAPNRANDDAKLVKFASTSPTLSRRRTTVVTFGHLSSEKHDDVTTLSTIRSLLHSKNMESESDEVVEQNESKGLESTSHSTQLASSSSILKKSKQSGKKASFSKNVTNQSCIDESTTTVRREGFARAKSRDEIYALYCTFGERKHTGQDFLSRILNILRQSTEGLLSHSEVYYKEKGSRHVTRPQGLCEKFDEFAGLMIEKLKHYEEQCLAHHAYSINEFRNILELFERTSSLMAKIELDEQIREGEKSLLEFKQQFDTTFNQKLNESNAEKQKLFESLRPALGLPGKKSDLEVLNNREKVREEQLEQVITQLQKDTLKYIHTNAHNTIQSLATSGERLVILFDEILTADEATQTRLPKVKHTLLELVKRQQMGKPLEEVESVPLIERKQGHWLGLPFLDEQFNRRLKSNTTKKHSLATSQRQKTTASIVTQKTTLPQIQTISQRDEAYQKYKDKLFQILTDVEEKCSTILTELKRYQTYWSSSIERLQHSRTNS